MTIGLTKFDRFVLTSHLVGLPSPGPEHGRRRLRAWDELKVTELADQLAFAAAGLGPVSIAVADWADRETAMDFEVSPEVLDYLIAGTGVQVAGIWADTVCRIRERLDKAKK